MPPVVFRRAEVALRAAARAPAGVPGARNATRSRDGTTEDEPAKRSRRMRRIDEHACRSLRVTAHGTREREYVCFVASSAECSCALIQRLASSVHVIDDEYPLLPQINA